MGFVKEFKEFAVKGNVMDMAVGVIIGAAFGKIVASLVNDVIMPLVSLFLGDVNFKDLKWIITPEVVDAAGAVTTPEVALLYGSFIQAVIDFLIIALIIFFMIRSINKLKKKEEVKPAAPAPKAADIVLLEEIRDLLKK